ncbi:MAG: FG-GAP repeat domain-containing protein [Flavisolibacter sp.]
MKKLYFFFLIVIFIYVYFSGCETSSRGEQLAKQHCRSCHMLPDPSLLDKTTWVNYVLPKMGGLLGFVHFAGGGYAESGKGADVMPLTDWQEIVAYYLKNAPDTLALPERMKIESSIRGFEVTMPVGQEKAPATTLVKILPGHLLYGDGVKKILYETDSQHVTIIPVNGDGVVNINDSGTTWKILDMGVLYPSDEKKGSLSEYDPATKQWTTLLDSLQRPVDAEYADLNQDHLTDIIICEFGNVTGQLGWYENTGNKKFVHHVLRPLPGSVRTVIRDVNHDGLPDIIALMAQGDEGIFMYVNKGNGAFEEQRLLQFPPSYGCNYFEMDDFNGDGFPDLLVTNGDNGDYPPVMKPYHGIRVYLNDGNFHFSEKFFLHQNGVEKAVARDFDGDGDLDIASISYFPDYQHHPEEGFLYWENVLPFSFRPYSIKEAVSGRWLTMDAGDADNDGDIDIILGNAAFSLGHVPDSLMKHWKESSPPVLLLRNKYR